MKFGPRVARLLIPPEFYFPGILIREKRLKPSGNPPLPGNREISHQRRAFPIFAFSQWARGLMFSPRTQPSGLFFRPAYLVAKNPPEAEDSDRGEKRPNGGIMEFPPRIAIFRVRGISRADLGEFAFSDGSCAPVIIGRPADSPYARRHALQILRGYVRALPTRGGARFRYYADTYGLCAS